MTKKYNKYLRNTINSTSMMTTEVIGINVTGKIAGGLTGTGATIANNAIGTGFGLAGTSSLVNTSFGKGGILDSMSSFGKTSRKRRK